jgi:hypothetical protein
MSTRPGHATGPAQLQPHNTDEQPRTALMQVVTTRTVDGELVNRVRPGRERRDVTARRMDPQPDPTTLAHFPSLRHVRPLTPAQAAQLRAEGAGVRARPWSRRWAHRGIQHRSGRRSRHQ